MGAVPCKGQGSVDMGLFAKAKEPFLRGFLKVENGVPSHATPEQSLPKGSRLFRRLDPERFLAAFQRFMMGFSKTTHAKPVVDAGHSRFESPAATVSPTSRGW